MARQRPPLAAMRNATLIATAVCVFTGVGIGGAGGSPPETELPIEQCPALYALGIQGTGESSPDAEVQTDTGMLSMVFRPMMAGAGEEGMVDRAYVPYEASFGGAVSNDKTPYSQSIANGLDRLKSMAKQAIERCDGTRVAITGYSQGAHVASLFAQEVGAGKGAIPADKVAAVALFGDPTRNANAPLFPGSPGKTAPDPAPGTDGAAVAALPAPPQSTTPASGKGIGPESDTAANFGSLSGRVASFCTTGDLACDAPTGAPLVTAVANIAGQVELSGGDPIASLRSIVDALASTSIKTLTDVVNKDISGTSITNLSISPQKSLSQRVAEASDPRTTVDLGGALQAVVKVGSIVLNSIVAVAKSILTPANIAEIATAGLANPLAGLAVLGTKLLGAVTELVPPATISRLVSQAFTAVVTNVTDNKDLLDVTTWVKYWNTAQKHDYANPQGAGFGESAAEFVGKWFAAVANDLAGVVESGGEPSGGSDRPGGGLDFKPSTAPSTIPPSGQLPFDFGATTAPSTVGGMPSFTTSGAPTSGYQIIIPSGQPQATP
ncbi:cutinase family protein [Nocardia sp. IFM 10818]